VSPQYIHRRSAEAVDPYLPTWLVGAPVIVLLGFLALLGRAGVGIQIARLPLGALLTPIPTVLVALLMSTRKGRAILSTFSQPQRRVAILVGVAIALGVVRAAAQGRPTLLTFQDMAYLLHLSWIIVGMAAMNGLRSDADRNHVLQWVTWTLLSVLSLHWARRVFSIAETVFAVATTGLTSMSDKPGLFLKEGDAVVFGVTLLALSIHLAGTNGSRRHPRSLLAGFLLGTHIAGILLGGSRGALLGAAIGLLALALAAGWRSMPLRIALVGVAVGVITAAVPILASAPVPVPDSRGHSETTEQRTSRLFGHEILERYEVLAGRRSLASTAEQIRLADDASQLPSEVSWRLDIWNEVVREWNSSWENRIFGIGFGNEIAAMTVKGRQGLDGLNRGVHNIAFTILARQGLTGVIVAAALLCSIVTIPAHRRLLVVPVTLAALTVGFFDVFIEGVQAPIFLWLFVGLSILGSNNQRKIISSKRLT